ncbi:MAG TPA: oligopeptide transporter, OPT family [Thermoanaerobaculia bacterium]|nr:oligopeptide transporter, OPT family [Thermoanaerobaculia bacterium]
MANEREFRPYVPAGESLAEFTAKAIIPGILFGIVFGAANAYLGLRAGLTISTSIPIAVMTVAAFKVMAAMGRRGTILEANISQTTGSASSSIASGVIFTIPALFIWGLDPTLLQMTLLAISGGILGVLFMIPLRRFLIEREHGNLPYPEGTACAEVLVAAEEGGGRAKHVFTGLAVGALFKALTGGIRIFPSHAEFSIPFLRKGVVGAELSAALFGVGFILGPRVAAVMVSGGLLSSLVIIPIIATWGEGRAVPFFPETELTIAAMSASQIWSRYVRYIGAGAVAAAGIITLIKSIPTMVESFKIGTRQLRARAGEPEDVPRTSQDLPFKTTLIGAGIIVVLLASVPQAFGSIDDFAHRAVAAVLIAIFAFFFVTVSSRIVGLVGVTSNPTSGMTIAALLGTSAVFLALGWTDDAGKMGALTVGAVVAIAASIAGDTSQDLKTGFLLGATPRRQQVAEIIGVLTSAAFVCLAVMLLDRVYGFGTRELPAPQATLMRLVIDGVLQNALPWTLVGIGVVIAVLASLLRLPVLAFAVGVYLPVATMVPIFLGGLLRLTAERRAPDAEEAGARRERGILLGSGFVGGEGLIGVAIAGVAFYLGRAPAGLGWAWAGAAAQWVSLAAFALLALFFWRVATRRDAV